MHIYGMRVSSKFIRNVCSMLHELFSICCDCVIVYVLCVTLVCLNTLFGSIALDITQANDLTALL